MKTKKPLWITALLVLIGTAVEFCDNINNSTKGENRT